MSLTKKDLEQIKEMIQTAIVSLPATGLPVTLAKTAKEKSIYNIKSGDWYVFINHLGDILKSEWIGDFTDPRRITSGSAFLTQEDAEHELAIRQAVQRVKRYIWEGSIEMLSKVDVMDGDVKKYLICYDSNIYNFDFSVFYTDMRYSPFGYFYTEEDVKQVIANCGDELKIIFEVE